ncbi:hypothetical protein ACS0TY_027268 [Phlomoides rotata]
MGNSGSTVVHDRRRNSGGRSHPPPRPEIAASRYVFAGATPNTANYPYPGYYPHPAAMPIPMPGPYNYHHLATPHRLPCGSTMRSPAYVEHQKAVTIRNDVNVKKETLRIEPDEENPGKYLVAFSFDATVAGSVTLIFFAKEGEDCHLTPMKESVYPPTTLQFQQGLGQKFKQASGTGIDLSTFEQGEQVSIDSSELSVYPLAVKAEASSPDNESTNCQITLAVFDKDKGEYQVKVVKQILWVNGMRYELQEIFGIGNSVEDELDPGKECVICLSEPRDTTVLPCRHMCMCSECAKVLRFQTNRCPICRQPVERLLEIKVSNGSDE